MAIKISLYRLARVAQSLLAIANFSISVYLLCSLLLYGTIFYAFATAIWTFSFAAPYLALAPIHNPRVERCFVIPAVEAVTMFLWLAVLIAQAYSLQSPMQYTLGGQKASQGATVLAALEWYVLGFGINFCSPVVVHDKAQ